MTNFTVMDQDARELLGRQIDELTGKVDALIRQRDALAEGRDNIQHELDCMNQNFGGMLADRDALRKENRELRRDKARIDWVCSVYRIDYSRLNDGSGRLEWEAADGRWNASHGEHPRAAMDDAIQTQSEQALDGLAVENKRLGFEY